MLPTDLADALWILGRLLLGLYFAAAAIHHFSAIEPLSRHEIQHASKLRKRLRFLARRQLEAWHCIEQSPQFRGQRLPDRLVGDQGALPAFAG